MEEKEFNCFEEEIFIKKTFMVLFSMTTFMGTEGQDTLVSYSLHFLSGLRWSVL